MWRALIPASVVATVLACATVAEAQKFSMTGNFETQDGGSAPEGMIAVGPDHILVMTHFFPNGIRIYSKSTHQLVGDFNVYEFFGNNGNGDPVCHYDPIGGRYLIVTMGPGTGQYLLVTKAGGNPAVMGDWYKYYAIGSSWIDYPGIGLSGDKLVITSSTGFNGTHYAWVLDRAAAYAGTYPEYPATISPPILDLGDGIEFKPCRNLTADNTIHLVGLDICETPGAACDVLVHTTITGPPASPNPPSTPAVVVTSADFAPPPAEQLGAPNQTDCQPKLLRSTVSRLADLYMRNGNITAAWTVGRDYGLGTRNHAAVRCVRFRASDRVKLDDFYVGSPGIDYTFPSAIEDKSGGILVGFDRTSPNEYPSAWMIARRGTQQSKEFRVRAGESYYIKCQNGQTNSCGNVAAWGDYTSMTMDEGASSTSVTKGYYLGQWGRSSEQGGTHVGLLTANYGNCSISGTVKTNVLGAVKPGVPIVLTQSGATVDSTTSDGAGNFSFGLLPTGVYILKMAWDPGVALEAHEGTGAFSTLVMSATEIWIQLKNNNQCVGNEFVVTEQPPPVISSLAPSFTTPGTGASLTVSGTGFQPWSVVRFDGRLKSTTYNAGPGTLTASISADDAVRFDAHGISVFTPVGPGPGFSNRALFFSAPQVIAGTGPTDITACPSGDGGHITASLTLQGSGTCGINAATDSVHLVVSADAGTGFAIWQNATVEAEDPPTYRIRGTLTEPVPGQKLWTMDAGKVSGCGTVRASFRIKPPSGASVVVNLPSFDLRSYDLEFSVHGTVDQFDVARINQLQGSGPGCGDFNRDGFTNSADATALNGHLGHRGQEMVVLYPNGGENLDRGLYGGEIPFSIRWPPGAGPEAKVTVNLVDGPVKINLATDDPDDGSFEWQGYGTPEQPGYCEVTASLTKKIEVIFSAGDLPPGSTTPGVFIGSDMSNANFRITGACPAPERYAREAAVPQRLELGSPRPNPTSDMVELTYAVPSAAHVRIRLYDAAGRVARTLVDGDRDPGFFQARWDLRLDSGGRAAPGVYFCRMEVGSWRQERKLTVGR